MEKGKRAQKSEAWHSTGSGWQRNQDQGSDWSWQTPKDQETGQWDQAGRQPSQNEEQPRRPEAQVEASETQANQKQDELPKGPADPRGPGGPMHLQPKRGGWLAPEDQVRGTEAFAQQGQFDENRQEPGVGQDGEADRTQQKAVESQDSAAKGKGGAKEDAESWTNWKNAGKDQGQAADGNWAKDGNQDPSWEGVPPGSEKIEWINGFRTPENDF
eukprot:932493-Heterocapsa_arctica.AAC.1